MWDIWWHEVLAAAALVAVVLVVHLVIKHWVLRFLYFVVRQTRVDWDQTLFEAGAFEALSYLVPALVLYQGARFFTPVTTLQQGLLIAIVVILVLAIHGLLNGLLAVYNQFPISLRKPLKGYFQIIKLFVTLAGAIIIISILLQRSPWYLLSGLGALTAVLMLIFQDTILSLIASIQLLGNDLIRVGDWLEVPKYDADGSVEEVALHSIKVRNWDATITTIPTHKLVQDSFRNWRGMTESGGRRIMRSLFIDQNSIAFLTDKDIAHLRGIALIRQYLDAKLADIAEHNRSAAGDPDITANGRRLTNVGTFRAYVDAYLRSHPRIRQDMTFVVRQLAPTPQGLPLEIMVFTNDTRWAVYEGIQADIFDHLLAVVPEFGLRVFQTPSGRDLARVSLGN